MENSLQIFDNPEFGKIRTIIIDNEPWFVGKDVAEALGYSNAKDALISHVGTKNKRIIQRSENATFEIPQRGLTIINESGLYRLIMSIKLPKAEEFQDWVTSEVLPSIRKHGLYATGDVLKATLENPEYIIGVLQRYKEEREYNKKLRAENSELRVDKRIMQPKAEYYDELVDRETLTSLTKTAKELGFKPRAFTGYLVEHKYLYRTKDRRLLPIQRHVDNGLFVLKECANEKTKWSGTQTLVTVKGRDIFRSLDLTSKA